MLERRPIGAACGDGVIIAARPTDGSAKKVHMWRIFICICETIADLSPVVICSRNSSVNSSHYQSGIHVDRGGIDCGDHLSNNLIREYCMQNC